MPAFPVESRLLNAKRPLGTVLSKEVPTSLIESEASIVKVAPDPSAKVAVPIREPLPTKRSAVVMVNSPALPEPKVSVAMVAPSKSITEPASALTVNFPAIPVFKVLVAKPPLPCKFTRSALTVRSPPSPVVPSRELVPADTPAPNSTVKSSVLMVRSPLSPTPIAMVVKAAIASTVKIVACLSGVTVNDSGLSLPVIVTDLEALTVKFPPLPLLTGRLSILIAGVVTAAAPTRGENRISSESFNSSRSKLLAIFNSLVLIIKSPPSAPPPVAVKKLVPGTLSLINATRLLPEFLGVNPSSLTISTLPDSRSVSTIKAPPFPVSPRVTLKTLAESLKETEGAESLISPPNPEPAVRLRIKRSLIERFSPLFRVMSPPSSPIASISPKFSVSPACKEISPALPAMLPIPKGVKAIEEELRFPVVILPLAEILIVPPVPEVATEEALAVEDELILPVEILPLAEMSIAPPVPEVASEKALSAEKELRFSVVIFSLLEFRLNPPFIKLNGLV